MIPGRAPHGARGLKYHQTTTFDNISRRAPHGARGLKLCDDEGNLHDEVCRAPHGARGLKSRHFPDRHERDFVAPHTGRVD